MRITECLLFMGKNNFKLGYVKYLKHINLLVLVCLMFLTVLQSKLIHEYLVEQDVGGRSEIGLLISLTAIGAVVISIPSIVYRRSSSKVGSILLALWFTHFLVFLVSLYF